MILLNLKTIVLSRNVVLHFMNWSYSCGYFLKCSYYKPFAYYKSYPEDDLVQWFVDEMIKIAKFVEF